MASKVEVGFPEASRPSGGDLAGAGRERRRWAVGSSRWTTRPSRHRDAGRLSYMAGLAGALAFMASGVGPGWVGFALAYLPASALAAWAVTPDA